MIMQHAAPQPESSFPLTHLSFVASSKATLTTVYTLKILSAISYIPLSNPNLYYITNLYPISLIQFSYSFFYSIVPRALLQLFRSCIAVFFVIPILSDKGQHYHHLFFPVSDTQ